MKTKLLLLLIILIVSCQSRRHYTRFKRGFSYYYFIKTQRQDNLRLFVYTYGIPHHTYLKIYADKDGEILSIIRERDNEQFYQAITHSDNGQYFFGKQIVIASESIKAELKTIELFDERVITEIIESKYCANLKLPKKAGWVRISPPKD